jgi:hypothetical protein
MTREMTEATGIINARSKGGRRADGRRNRSHRPRPWPFPLPSAGLSVAVRGPFRLRPWTSGPPNPGTHGHIADGGDPESRLEVHKCWSAGNGSGRAFGL